jgi:predicted methyltransferase
MKISSAAAAAALALVLCGPVHASPESIGQALADTRRPEADRKSDIHRLPYKTLLFSGVKPGDVVGEFLPGGGYYTRLLSDVVGPHGTVYALETTRWGQQNIDATKAVLSEKSRGNVKFDASAFGEFNLPEKADVFWTTLNYHDLHIEKYGKVDMAAFNKHVYDSLKAGGVYFIVDHTANPGATDEDVAKLHRIDKAVVIKEVTAAGFELAGESSALHHSADDHTLPVFDASVRGKTNQFMLKFRKP